MTTLYERLDSGTSFNSTISYDTADASFLKANAAYGSQNTTGVYANTSYYHANGAYLHANASYSLANTLASNTTATLAFLTANSAYRTANSAGSYANSAYVSQNTTGVYANTAYSQANTATTNAATADQRAVTSGVYANSAYRTANSASSYANGAFVVANTKFNSSGGTISGDVTVTGNLIISGTTTTVNANNLTVQDNMIYLNHGLSKNTYPDLGLVGAYSNGTYQHTGIFRDQSDGIWKFFDGYRPEPDESIFIDTSNSSFRIASLTANLITDSATIRGYDPINYANAIYSFANTLNVNLQSAYNQANTATTNLDSWVRNAANSAYNQANTATTNAATADQKAVSAGVYANSAYSTANTKFSSSGGTISGGVTISSGGLAVTGALTATGDITAYYSDERLKDILGNIENALEKVTSLSGFYYEPNEIAQSLGYEVKREVGVSAQQVQSIMPEIVAAAPIDNHYLTVRYERLVPLLIEAIKELNQKIETLKTPK